MDLAEFREKYPEYDHASDDDLSRALHKRHYSHVPYKTFRGKFNPPGWVDTVQSSFQKAGYRMGTATGGIRQSHAEDVVEGIDELQAMGTGEKFRQMNFGEDLINDAPPPPSEEGSFLDRMESKRAEVLSDMQERAREEVEVGKHIGAEFRALYEGESVDYPIERGDRMLSTERGKYYVSHTVESLFGSMLPALAVGAATRSPKLAASTMFPVVYGEEYSNRRAEGMSPTDASVTAAFYGLSESLTEMIPLAKWLGSAGAPFLKRVFGTGMSEGLSEVLNEALQIGWDTGVLNEEMSLQEGIQQVTDAFIIGGMMGTTFGALPAGGKEGNTPGPDGRTPVDILREEAKKQRPVSDLVDEILEETGATEEERGPDLALEDIDPVSGIGTHREPSALEQTLEGIPEDTGPALGAIESLDVPPGTTVEMEDHAKAAEVKKAIDEAASNRGDLPRERSYRSRLMARRKQGITRTRPHPAPRARHIHREPGRIRALRYRRRRQAVVHHDGAPLWIHTKVRRE